MVLGSKVIPTVVVSQFVYQEGVDIRQVLQLLDDYANAVQHVLELVDVGWRWRRLGEQMLAAIIREHATKAVLRLQESLVQGCGTDVARAKEALAKHVGKLILTPTVRMGRPAYKVSGADTVEGGTEKSRMQVVARDGIEPPTPAFSGLRSTS